MFAGLHGRFTPAPCALTSANPRAGHDIYCTRFAPANLLAGTSRAQLDAACGAANGGLLTCAAGACACSAACQVLQRRPPAPSTGAIACRSPRSRHSLHASPAVQDRQREALLALAGAAAGAVPPSWARAPGKDAQVEGDTPSTAAHEKQPPSVAKKPGVTRG